MAKSYNFKLETDELNSLVNKVENTIANKSSYKKFRDNINSFYGCTSEYRNTDTQKTENLTNIITKIAAHSLAIGHGINLANKNDKEIRKVTSELIKK